MVPSSLSDRVKFQPKYVDCLCGKLVIFPKWRKIVDNSSGKTHRRGIIVRGFALAISLISQL